MAFLSFHMDYYCKELEQLENSAVTEANIYHTKQLLKILDDLLEQKEGKLIEKSEYWHQWNPCNYMGE